MRLRCLPILVSLLALGSELAGAQPAPQPLLDVERLIAQNLAPGQRRHRFVESTRILFDHLDLDRDGAITEDDRQRSRQSIAAMERPQIVAQFLNADFDGDGVVTHEELKRYVDYMRRIGSRVGPPDAVARREQGLANWLAALMRADTNGDGRIEWSEMIAHAQRTPLANRLATLDPAYQTMFTFDADGDGRSTMAEFVAGLEKRFSDVDTDDDDIISQDEFTTYWQRAGRPPPQVAAIAQTWEEKQAEQCKLPRPPKDARVIVFNGYSFEGLSSVAVGSQDEVTKATRVTIEPGREPLYLVLIGGQRVIWQFEGAVERVKHVVLASVTANDGKPTPTGVTGLPKEVLTFGSSSTCGNFWVNMNAKSPGSTQEKMRLLAGRVPDALIDRDEVWNLRLPSGETSRPTPDERRRGIPSTGAAEPDVSRFSEQLLMYRRAGVVRIDPADVISGQPAASYEVLPEYAGLIQLMQAGAIDVARNGNILVKRQIRIPPGLGGGLSERFVVLKGVPTPTGNPVHSTVISEETGAPLCRDHFCPPQPN